MNNLFEGYGINSGGFLNLSAKETYLLCQQGAIILDVRKETMNQHKVFDVEKVIYCPYDQIELNFALLPADSFLIVADAVGLHSKEAILNLLNNGFKNIANLAGGLVDWERDGLPIKTDTNFELNGACVCRLRTRKK
jgi:rhodanese-related sulfurtransferase